MNPPNGVPQDPEDDWPLVERTARGDSSAFSELFERHKLRVYRLALRVTGDSPAAEDVAQDVFIKLRRHPPRRAAARFTTWLYRVAVNAALDAVRARRWKRLLHRSVQEPETAGQPEPADTAPSAPEALASRERDAAVRAAVARLPDSLRVPLVLYQFDNLSYAEIAEVIGVSAKAVERRLARAREELKSLLSKYLIY